MNEEACISVASPVTLFDKLGLTLRRVSRTLAPDGSAAMNSSEALSRATRASVTTLQALWGINSIDLRMMQPFTDNRTGRFAEELASIASGRVCSCPNIAKPCTTCISTRAFIPHKNMLQKGCFDSNKGVSVANVVQCVGLCHSRDATQHAEISENETEHVNTARGPPSIWAYNYELELHQQG